MSTGWGRHFPYYHLAADGRPVTEGDFTHSRALTTLGYFLLTRPSLLDASGTDVPLRSRSRRADTGDRRRRGAASNERIAARLVSDLGLARCNGC